MALLENRSRRGAPLTFRLLLVLVAASVAVSAILAYFGTGVERRRRIEDQQARAATCAADLAVRIRPLLAAPDDDRLALLCAAMAEQGDLRIVVLDRSGFVRCDTAGELEGQQPLLARRGAPHRPDQGGFQHVVPIRDLVGRAGEVRVSHQPIAAAAVPFAWSLFGGAFLASLSLVVIACVLCHHWMLHVRECVATAAAFGRGDVLARCRRRAGGVIAELQTELHELGVRVERGHHAAYDSFMATAEQLVQRLEQNRGDGHANRTLRYAKVIAHRLGLPVDETRDLESAARLHDLGEAFVRPALIEKEGPLTDEERDCLLHVPDRAADLIGALPRLRQVANTVRHLREKFDGSGYPDGLRGERIPLGSRILALAETYDHLTTGAIQGRVMSWTAALEQLATQRGERFDPWLLDLFAEEIRREPMPERPLALVTISPAGVIPQRVLDPSVAPGSSVPEPSVQDDLRSAEQELDLCTNRDGTDQEAAETDHA